MTWQLCHRSMGYLCLPVIHRHFPNENCHLWSTSYCQTLPNTSNTRRFHLPFHRTSFTFFPLFLVSQDPLVPCQCRGVSSVPWRYHLSFSSFGFLPVKVSRWWIDLINSLRVYVILCLCIHHIELHCNTHLQVGRKPNILLRNPVQFLTIKIVLLSHPNLWPWACEST